MAIAEIGRRHHVTVNQLTAYAKRERIISHRPGQEQLLLTGAARRDASAHERSAGRRRCIGGSPVSAAWRIGCLFQA